MRKSVKQNLPIYRPQMKLKHANAQLPKRKKPLKRELNKILKELLLLKG